MHELSIAMSIVEGATEQAERHCATRVNRIHLKIGPLSGVLPEALVSAFSLAREGSAVESAELVVEEMPITVYCSKCQGPRGVVSMQKMACVECGRLSADILTGRELQMVALELQ
jgi:hydrogenase nickel incorporation protein HypA/HybF